MATCKHSQWSDTPCPDCLVAALQAAEEEREGLLDSEHDALARLEKMGKDYDALAARLRAVEGLLRAVVKDFEDDGPGYCCLRGDTYDAIRAHVRPA